ncbi:YqgE/AlgH family protein [secondary endosymbiont of Heteropsylla cubana]
MLSLDDLLFTRSIIYVFKHDNKRAIGLIINKSVKYYLLKIFLKKSILS